MQAIILELKTHLHLNKNIFRAQTIIEKKIKESESHKPILCQLSNNALRQILLGFQHAFQTY